MMPCPYCGGDACGASAGGRGMCGPYADATCQVAPASRHDRGPCASSPSDWRASDILAELLADDTDVERPPARNFSCVRMTR